MKLYSDPCKVNKDKYTKNILKHLAIEDIENGSEILSAELATNISRYDFAIQIAKTASYEKRFINNFNYPIISTPQYINGRKIPESALIPVSYTHLTLPTKA